MAAHLTLSRSPKALTPALQSYVLPFLCPGAMEHASLRFDHPFCTLASELLKYLPSIIVAVGQTLGSYALDHLRFFACVETLVTLWSVLRLIAGAA
ncbi:MAG: hypothetical protein M3P45_01890 [Acidobacteriota bacterium]|nr:hypothetical protein [Acidobacteriota bacterium]